MTTWARFWAVDLHVHTPASRDVDVAKYGGSSAGEVVQAAIKAGLDCIAVTDHNTADWCERVARAAAQSALVVLPGVEISTSEGHLLAIWDEGTSPGVVEDLLVKLGIERLDHGKLDVSATAGFAEAAKQVVASHGLAIAAHVDRPRGLLKLPVATHVNKLLRDENLAAVELVEVETIDKVKNKLGDKRSLACLRGSDCTLPTGSTHVLAGIGSRRSWIKASRPDFSGIRHALEDPALRVRLEEPGPHSHATIDSVTVKGGFLDRQPIHLSPDLNCLLGGTGAGKSLVLEAVRFAVAQEVDASAFPAIAKDIASRMQHALVSGSVVQLETTVDGEHYVIERVYSEGPAAKPAVYQVIEGQRVKLDRDPTVLLRISAFSQGEILEYSRQPVGRMSLVDAGLDLSGLATSEEDAIEQLQQLGEELLVQRTKVAQLRQGAGRTEELTELTRELATFFDTDLVKHQQGWQTEASRITKARQALPLPDSIKLPIPTSQVSAVLEGNQDVFAEVSAVVEELRMAASTLVSDLRAAITDADSKLAAIEARWATRREAFTAVLDAELANKGASLVALRRQLATLQAQLAESLQQKRELEETAEPRLNQLYRDREELLEELRRVRDERRYLRRKRVQELNKKTAGIVKLDVPAQADTTAFRAALDLIKVGSRVRDSVLDAIATHVHPFSLARALLAGDIAVLANESKGIDAGSVARLLSNVDERDLWGVLLDAQVCSMPDQLAIQFKRPEDGQYVSIEELAHGQKCTAVLVVLLADGVCPVVVDQPEDALHAPWIEDYLVDRLRDLRGNRQYLFATRSPGIVVGGDAEQLITMRATAGRGEVEATGSLERHDLNKLALYHLEGGANAFRRRSGKLSISMLFEATQSSGSVDDGLSSSPGKSADD
jgi:hypothetical protein